MPYRLAISSLTAAILLAATLHAGDANPRIWMFSGHPGDDEHEQRIGGTVSELLTLFRHRCGIPAGHIRVRMGPDCTRPLLLQEIADIAEAACRDDPVWIFFFGHANPTPRGANYNLVGPDIPARDLGRACTRIRSSAPVVIVFTTAASGAFLAPLAAPGRIVVTATLPQGEDNETIFPAALAHALAQDESDADADGTLSVREWLDATNRRVEAFYAEKELIQTEHALLDETGDGLPEPLNPEPGPPGPADHAKLTITGHAP